MQTLSDNCRLLENSELSNSTALTDTCFVTEALIPTLKKLLHDTSNNQHISAADLLAHLTTTLHLFASRNQSNSPALREIPIILRAELALVTAVHSSSGQLAKDELPLRTRVISLIADLRECLTTCPVLGSSSEIATEFSSQLGSLGLTTPEPHASNSVTANNSLEIAAPYELFAPIRLIGASLSIFANRLNAIERLTGDSKSPLADVFFRRCESTDDPVCTPLLAFASFENILPRQALYDVSLPYEDLRNEIAGALRDLLRLQAQFATGVELNRVTRNLMQLSLCIDDLEKKAISTSTFIESIFALHEKLCADTMFRELPAEAKQLRLSMIEFNTEVLGLPLRGWVHSTPLGPFQILPEIRQIDSELQIDPTLNKPQEALGRIRADNEEHHLLSTPATRVFLLRSNREAIGYCMLLTEARSEAEIGATPLLTAALLSELQGKGFLASRSLDQLGEVRSVAVRTKGRLDFARAGINAADILDLAMNQTAEFEGCAALIAAVRVGLNANSSIKAHLRRGWIRTGVTINDGGSEVLIYENDAVRGDAPRQDRRTRKSLLSTEGDPPYCVRRHPSEFQDGMPLKPSVITEYWAKARALAAAEVNFQDREPNVSITYDRGCMAIHLTKGNTLVLRQLRPKVDWWERDFDRKTGVLDYHLDIFLPEWVKRDRGVR